MNCRALAVHFYLFISLMLACFRGGKSVAFVYTIEVTGGTL